MLMTKARAAAWDEHNRRVCRCCNEKVEVGEEYVAFGNGKSAFIQHLNACPRRKAQRTERRAQSRVDRFTDTLDEAKRIFREFNGGTLTHHQRDEQLDELKDTIEKMRPADKSYLRGYIDARVFEQDNRDRG